MKERLDILLVQRGLADTQAKSQALILTGTVLVNDAPVDKPGTRVSVDSAIRLRGQPKRFVSRGGEKLEGALNHFVVDVAGVVALDVGASTGGFTDCLLQRGAKHVYAVDVGSNQLDFRLRQDSRVTSMEQFHVKRLAEASFSEPPTIAVVDLSFIGARTILHYIVPVLATPAKLLVLVKPQFELPSEAVAEGGVVADEALHQEAVALVESEGERLGLRSQGSVLSVLPGAKSGNREYFIYFLRQNIL